MKKLIFLFFIIAAAGLPTSCASKQPPPVEEILAAEPEPPPPPPPQRIVTFENIKNTNWRLLEVRNRYGAITLDRTLMASSQMADFFSLQFISEGVSGKAAPNRYFAPYALISGNDLAIRPLAQTNEVPTSRMALSEQRYLTMLQRMTRWEMRDAYLYIYTPDDTLDDELMLIFYANL